MKEAFQDVLNEYMKREERTPTQLKKLTGIPRPTLNYWLYGSESKPRKWDQILLVAEKLNLERSEADRLLRSAQYNSIDGLMRQARDDNDEDALEILQRWQDPVPFQVPARRKIVVAREDDVEHLKKMLFRHHICVLYGMGGVGKTTLANHLAYTLRDSFPDGVLWARVDNSNLMAIYSSFAEGYDRDVSRYDDVRSRGRVIRNLLSNKKVLIVLDNAEQAQDVLPLLPPTTDSCTVLITTRNKKLLVGEAYSYHLMPFTETGGLILLTGIVGATKVNINLEVARQIVRLVGGLPLAIKVVSSILHEGIITFQEFKELLQDEATSLDGLIDDTDTTKNVRACFELSYRQLTKPLRQLFTTLAVFAGNDFCVEAVTFVSHQQPVRIKKGLGQLHSFSLLEISQMNSDDATASQTQSQGIRFRLHPLIQAFVYEKARPQLRFLQKQAANYFIEFVQRYTENPEDYGRIDQEYENVLNALEWALAQDEWQKFIQGILALTQMQLGAIGYLDARGYWDKAIHLLDQALNYIDWLNEPLKKAQLLANKGAFAVRRADADVAEEHLRESLELLDTLPVADEVQLLKANVNAFLARTSMRHDPIEALEWCTRGIAACVDVEIETADHELGNLYVLQATILGRTGQMSAAITAAETGLSLLPSRSTSAHVTGLNALSNIYAIRGDTRTSKSFLDKAIEQAKGLRDERTQAILWMNQGISKELRGNLKGALKDHERAYTLYQQIGEVDETGSACVNIALVQMKLGKWEHAKEQIDTAVSLSTQHNLPDLTTFAMVALGNWYVERGQLHEASVALRKAYAACQQFGMRFVLPILLYWQAQVMMGNGRFPSAARILWYALTIAHADNQSLEAGMCWRQVGILLDMNQQFAAAHQAYETSQRLLENEDPFEKACLIRALATHYLNHSDPNPGKAHTLLKQAFIMFKELEAEVEAARTEQMLDAARAK